MVDYRVEGIKYMGSKAKLLPHIHSLIKDLDIKTVSDLFSGSTRVTQFFARNGYEVYTNDLAEYSKVFSTCYLKSKKSDEFYQSIINELNGLDGYNGFLTEHYGGDTNNGEGKKPFSIENTMRADAILRWLNSSGLAYEDRCVILTSLMYGLDKIDNTLGHFVSYPKGWSSRSKKSLNLILPGRFVCRESCEVYQEDALLLAGKLNTDLAYIDVPYGSNNIMPSSRVRYKSYYHIWETIARTDQPKVFGKCNRREDSRDKNNPSEFEEYRKDENGTYMVYHTIDKLIRNCSSRYILFSYNNNGRLQYNDIIDILSSNGKLLKVETIEHSKNVMSQMKSTEEWVKENSHDKNVEFLFLMEK